MTPTADDYDDTINLFLNGGWSMEAVMTQLVEIYNERKKSEYGKENDPGGN